jgi:hypothetical protein
VHIFLRFRTSFVIQILELSAIVADCFAVVIYFFKNVCISYRKARLFA